MFLINVSMSVGMYYGFSAGTVYIRIEGTGQVGEAAFKLIVES